MGHRAIHPNLCLASRNTYSRSTLGDLEKITEQLEWWAPLLSFCSSIDDSCVRQRFLVSYRPLAPSLLHFSLGALSVRMPTKMFEQ